MDEAQKRTFVALSALRATAPPGELEAFGGLLAAHQYRHAYAFVETRLPPSREVLDWGCGDGHFSWFLLAAGHRVTSFTLQHLPHALAELPEDLRPGHRFVRGGLEEPRHLPFVDGSFDVVFSIGVLEHVRELGGSEEASLREINRVLRREGLFVCFHLPNRWSWIEAASRFKPGQGAADRFHRFRFTAADIRRLCAETGFSLLEHGRYGFLPRNLTVRLPRAARHAPGLARVFDRIDGALERSMPAICQNHFFLAQAGARPRSPAALD